MSMQVERLAEDRFRVSAAQRTAPTLHIARHMPLPPSALPLLFTSDTPEAHTPGAFVRAVAALPEHMAMSRATVMADLADSGLCQPWSELSSSGLQVPLRTSYDITLQRSVGCGVAAASGVTAGSGRRRCSAPRRGSRAGLPSCLRRCYASPCTGHSHARFIIVPGRITEKRSRSMVCRDPS